MKEKNSSKIMNYILIGIIILLLAAIAVGIFMYKKALTPDYAPGTIDTNAIPTPDDGSKMNKSEGGGAVSLSYSNVVSIDLSKKNIKMYFKNPSKSTQAMVIQVILESGGKEYIIGQTDRVPSGYTVYDTKLLNTVSLKAGGYTGKFNVMYYDEETEEKAIVNTNIPIKIEVK